MRIYTDASTRAGISGVAFVVTDARDNIVTKKAAMVKEQDNNTAELRAILFALAYTRNTEEYTTILTDSTYAINAIRNGSNRPSEKKIIDYIRKNLKDRKCSIFWVKGHCQDGTVLSYYNKQADKTAKAVRITYEREQYKKKKLQKRLLIERLRKGKNK